MGSIQQDIRLWGDCRFGELEILEADTIFAEVGRITGKRQDLRGDDVFTANIPEAFPREAKYWWDLRRHEMRGRLWDLSQADKENMPCARID